MEMSSSNHLTDSHTSLHLDSNSSSNSDEGEITFTAMDSSVYKAAADGDIHAFRQFSEADLQKHLSPKGNSVLHIAAQFGQLRCVRWILGFCSSSLLLLLQRQNLKGDTPLHIAAREGHLLVVRALIDAAKLVLLPPSHIESGIVINGAETEKAMLRLTNKEGDTALHEAIRYNHCEVVKFLIMEDPDFGYGQNISGGTPLYMAAERGFHKLVEIIIDNTRTSPGYTGFTGRTALHAAVLHDHIEMTKKILEWKPELSKEVDEYGWSPLHYAAYRGCNTMIVKELLDKSDKSVVPYLRIKDGNQTALHIAGREGHRKIVEILASHSPDCCEQVDDKGRNIFHFAMMKKGSFTSCDLLKQKWLSVRGLINERDGEGDTPLHYLASAQVYDPIFVSDDKVDKMAFNNEILTPFDVFSRAKNIRRCKDHNLHHYFEGVGVANIGPKRLQEVTKEDNDNDNDSRRSQDNGGGGNINNRGTSSKLRESLVENHLIVAALIATVTFAAGFTLPGGYNQTDGVAILSRKAAFKAFVVMNTIAMVLSISAVSNYFFMSLHNKKVYLDTHRINGVFLTMFAMAAMVVAFMTGLYAVLPHSSLLPIFVCIICCFFFICFFFGCKLLLQHYKVRIHQRKNRKIKITFSW